MQRTRIMWPQRQTRSSNSSGNNSRSSRGSSTHRIRNTSVHNLRSVAVRCHDTLDELKPQLSSSFSIENALFETEEHNRSPKKKKLIGRNQKHSTINKFLEDNQSYYKIEIFNGKLRSSSTTSSSSTISTSAKVKSAAVTMKKQQKVTVAEPLPVVVKSEPRPVKRRSFVRSSEIALLNSEAVKFLFPPSPKSSRSSSSSGDSASESDTGEHDLKTKPNKRRKQTVKASKKCRLKRKIKKEIVEESPVGDERCDADDESNDVPAVSPRPAASDPVARSVPASLPVPQNYFVAHNIDLDEILSNVDTYLDMNCLRHEAWYQTFERQDNFEEDLFKPTFLSIDMIDFLPKTIQVRNPVICRNHFNKLTAGSESESAAKPLPKQTNKGIRKYRKLLVGGSGISRKSPRKHASTLAILGSLKQKNTTVKVQRKSKTNSPSNRAKIAAAAALETASAAPAATTATATATPKLDASSKDDSLLSDDLVEPRSQQYFYEIVQNIYRNESQPEVKSMHNLVQRRPETVTANAENDDIELYLKALRAQPLAPGRSGSFSSGSGSAVTATRLHRFKRKRNRTGWPKKRRFLTKQKPSPVPVRFTCVPAAADTTVSSPAQSVPAPPPPPVCNASDAAAAEVDINSNPLPKSPLLENSVGEPPPLQPKTATETPTGESDRQHTDPECCAPVERLDTAAKTLPVAVQASFKTSPRLLATRPSIEPSLSSAAAKVKPFVRLKNFTFSTFRPSARVVRSASLTTTPNGDYSFRRLRSARNTFFSRTR